MLISYRNYKKSNFTKVRGRFNHQTPKAGGFVTLIFDLKIKQISFFTSLFNGLKGESKIGTSSYPIINCDMS